LSCPFLEDKRDTKPEVMRDKEESRRKVNIEGNDKDESKRIDLTNCG